MIWFSLGDFIVTVISASVYGIGFSIFCILIRGVFLIVKGLKTALFHSFFYSGKLFELPKAKYEPQYNFFKMSAQIFSALSVIIFTIGLSVLSYFTLDGEMRWFIILLSVCGFILSEALFAPFAKRIIFFFSQMANLVIIIIFRIATCIPRRIFLLISTKYGEKNKFMGVFGVISSYLTLDSREM